jgi:hypothetical protein
MRSGIEPSCCPFLKPMEMSDWRSSQKAQCQERNHYCERRDDPHREWSIAIHFVLPFYVRQYVPFSESGTPDSLRRHCITSCKFRPYLFRGLKTPKIHFASRASLEGSACPAPQTLVALERRGCRRTALLQSAENRRMILLEVRSGKYCESSGKDG